MSTEERTPATAATTGTVQTLTPAQRFRTYMVERAARESAATAEDVSANQIDKIFAVDDDDPTKAIDGIFDAVSGGTIQGRDCVGLEVEIHSMRLQESDRFEGSSYYGNLDITVLGGPREVLTRTGLTIGAQAVFQTGAEIILAMVRAFEARDLLPVPCVIAGTETSSGFTVLKLSRLPERSTPATK